MQAGWTAEDSVILQQLLTPTQASSKPVQSPMLIVQNKVDLLSLQTPAQLQRAALPAVASPHSNPEHSMPCPDECRPAAESWANLVWSAAELQQFLIAQHTGASGDNAPTESVSSTTSCVVSMGSFKSIATENSGAKARLGSSEVTHSHPAASSLHHAEPADLQSDDSQANSKTPQSELLHHPVGSSVWFHARVLSTSASKGTGLQQLQETIALAAGCGHIAPGIDNRRSNSSVSVKQHVLPYC